PSILGKAGVKYFFAGLPTYFEWKRQAMDVPPGHTFWDEEEILRTGRPDAFKWEGPDGTSVLVYYQGSYGFFLGGVPESSTSPENFNDVIENLPGFLEDMEENGTPFSVMRYIDHGVDNYPPKSTISHTVREWNKRFAYPKLVVSTNQKFFDKLEEQCENLRVFKGELPHTDYTICATSKASETALNRETHERLTTTEKLATINSNLTGSPYPLFDIESIYKDVLLYDEHCFGLSQPFGKVQDWNWSSKNHHAYRAAGKTHTLLTNKINNIARNIKISDKNEHIVVFNPLSFVRTDIVRVTNFKLSKEKFKIIDEKNGEEVKYQLVKIDDPDNPKPYAPHRYAMGEIYGKYNYELVFVASDIPSLGYKSFKIIKESDQSFKKKSKKDFNINMENKYYKIKLDEKDGSIVSIVDRELNKELIDQNSDYNFDQNSDYNLNQLIINNIDSNKTITPEKADIKPGEKGAVYQSLIVSTQARGCPKLVQEIILYNDLKKIDIINRVLKDTTPLQEFYFAFPFAVEDPQFKYEGTNSVIEPFKDQFPGSNTNYYTVQHWAEAANDDIKIVLSSVDAHNMEFGGLWPSYVSQAHHGAAPEGFGEGFIDPDKINMGHMYSYIINGNYRTNFPSVQQGDILFRYSITSEEVSSKHPTEFGWSNSNPLISTKIHGKQKGYLENSLSFCQIKPENVMMLNLKRAENGNGIILRLLETEGKDCNALIKTPFIPVKSAYLTNIVEEDKNSIYIVDGKLQVKFYPYEIKTVRLIPEKESNTKSYGVKNA
ncbi:MAG: glycosyl hydrolase-related protein, partial [Bacillota bacterium]